MFYANSFLEYFFPPDVQVKILTSCQLDCIFGTHTEEPPLLSSLQGRPYICQLYLVFSRSVEKIVLCRLGHIFIATKEISHKDLRGKVFHANPLIL